MRYSFDFSFLRSSMKWLCMLVLCLSTLGTSAAEDIQLPPRTLVWDQAGVLGDSVSDLEFALQTLPRQLQEKHIQLYIVTVKDEYRPYMKEFIASICSGWHICDNNDDVLLVVTDAHSPWVYVYAGADNKYVPEVAAHYLAERCLKPYPGGKTPMSIAAEFINDVPMFVSGREQYVLGSGYDEYRATYKPGTPLNADRLDMPVVPWYARLYYRLLTLAVMILMPLSLVVLWRARKGTM